MVREHLSPRFLPQDIQNGGIGPRDNVFPGPAVALDGPVHWLCDNFAIFYGQANSTGGTVGSTGGGSTSGRLASSVSVIWRRRPSDDALLTR